MDGQGAPGSDGATTLPFAWLKERLDSIEKRMAEHNGAIRADMTANFADLRHTLSENDRAHALVEQRVTSLEVERNMEKLALSRYRAVVGSIVAGVIIFSVVEIVKKVMGH